MFSFFPSDQSDQGQTQFPWVWGSGRTRFFPFSFLSSFLLLTSLGEFEYNLECEGKIEIKIQTEFHQSVVCKSLFQQCFFFFVFFWCTSSNTDLNQDLTLFTQQTTIHTQRGEPIGLKQLGRAVLTQLRSRKIEMAKAPTS